MTKSALKAAGHKLEVASRAGTQSAWGGYSGNRSTHVLSLGSINLVTTSDADHLPVLNLMKTEVYEPAFQDYWEQWVLNDYNLRWNIASYNYDMDFHNGVMASTEDDRVKMFALLCQKHMKKVDAALDVAREHVKTHASRSPQNQKELLMYLHPALAQYGEKYFDLLRTVVTNASSLDALKSEEARDFQLQLFNMTYGYNPSIHKDILVKDWELVEIPQKGFEKTTRSFSYLYAGVPFKVKAFRDYAMNLRVADLLLMPNVIPKNTAGKAAIKIMDDYLAGNASTPADRLNLTVSAFQALVKRYSTNDDLVKREIYGDLFSDTFMPMKNAENLMQMLKTYFESDESATAQPKTWTTVLAILIGTDKNKWAKSVATADKIASLMLKEMDEMEAIGVLRSLVGEDPPIPPMTPTQWIKYLEVYKEYKDSPPSIIVSLIR